MKDTDYQMPYRTLKVTFVSGEVDAGNLYLPRDLDEDISYSEFVGPGLVADYTEEDRLIGLELREPAAIDAERVDEVLQEHGHPPLEDGELDPILAPHRMGKEATPGKKE